MNSGCEFESKIEGELRTMIREKIAPFATPDFIQSAPGLPKTRSGKIMRRVLKKIANNDKDLGDISTMADSSVVEVRLNQIINSPLVYVHSYFTSKVLFTKREEMMKAKGKKK